MGTFWAHFQENLGELDALEAVAGRTITVIFERRRQPGWIAGRRLPLSRQLLGATMRRLEGYYVPIGRVDRDERNQDRCLPESGTTGPAGFETSESTLPPLDRVGRAPKGASSQRGWRERSAASCMAVATASRSSSKRSA